MAKEKDKGWRWYIELPGDIPIPRKATTPGKKSKARPGRDPKTK